MRACGLRWLSKDCWIGPYCENVDWGPAESRYHPLRTAGCVWPIRSSRQCPSMPFGHTLWFIVASRPRQPAVLANGWCAKKGSAAFSMVDPVPEVSVPSAVSWVQFSFYAVPLTWAYATVGGVESAKAVVPDTVVGEPSSACWSTSSCSKLRSPAQRRRPAPTSSTDQHLALDAPFLATRCVA